MSDDRLIRLLHQVRLGDLSPDDAVLALRGERGDEAVGNFAKVDLGRKARCGVPEVIFGPGKTAEQVAAILHTLVDNQQCGFATRIEAETGTSLLAAFPEGRYNAVARTFHVGAQPGPGRGRVVVVTAGTSDLPVAEEARETACAWGCDVSLLVDVGVAGLHRLLSRLEILQGADALVVVAGMEGALPSVVGGLVDCPVVAVPTSIGYGASFGGLAAMLGMLNSCASNVTVVNIDAGFNGGYMAGLIASRASLARNDSLEFSRK